MSEARAPVERYDPGLAEAGRTREADEIALIARVTDTAALPAGIRVVSSFGDIVTLRATPEQVKMLADCPAAVDLEAARRISPPTPSWSPDDAIELQGTPEHSRYSRRPDELQGTGSGVVVAALDWGFDFAIPAFRRRDGSTRFVALWDQRGSQGSGPDNRWGYGRVFTGDDIDHALASPDPFATLEYNPADVGAGPAHGTHVLDIAGGSQRDDGMTGVAPESDLVAVHLAHTTRAVGPGNLGESASLLEALDFVFSIAGARPAVVNMSVGAQGGSHDGSSLVEQGIDQAIRLGRRRFVVMSIGNYARTGAHRHGRLREGERATLTIAVPVGDPSPSEIEIWYSGADRFAVTVFAPDGSTVASARSGDVVPLRLGANELGQMYHVRSARNGRHLVDILLAPHAPGGDWTIEITAESVEAGDGRFFSWIERESGPRPRFIPEDDDPRTTTGSLCNGRLSIGVGAYDPHTTGRPVASFSSGGPTVAGLVKPEILAPGVRIPAARSTPRGGTPEPSIAVMSGTSMAAPHVTGTVAVMLEAADEALDVLDVRAILLATAERPSLAAHHADLHRVGGGYLDPVAAERVIDTVQFHESLYLPSEFAMTTPADDVYLKLAEALDSEPAETSPPLSLSPPPQLPLVLAGPIVRRATPEAVWFWIACSDEILNCTPNITVYNMDGSPNTDLTRRMQLAPTAPQIVRLGEHLWVALVAARPTNLTFSPGWVYGYDLTIDSPTASTSVRLKLAGIAYEPFDRPTFLLHSSTKDRIAHGSCRRPGGYGVDACVVFDKWVGREIRSGAKGERPPALFLTGDQIYADDIAYPLFQAVRRLAADVFGYEEHLPLPDGTGTISTAQLNVNDWRGKSDVDEWIASARARLTRHPLRDVKEAEYHRVAAIIAKGGAGSAGEPSRSPHPPSISDRDIPGRIGFTTEDGEGHLLSFAEFAAMYLLVWNPDLWARYVREEPGSNDPDTDNLTAFGDSAKAARRLLANMPTYMLFDDHEITDDWNLDGDWKTATDNPMARRIISNGLAAYWAFQGWGNDPGQFGAAFISGVSQHLTELLAANGRPGAGAPSFDAVLHGKYWAYAAPTRPPVLCVDTRTKREFLPTGKTVMTGVNAQPALQQLLSRSGFKRGEPLTVVLPTPFLGHRSMFKAQSKEYPWPRDRYAGDYELYGNYPEQRPDLVWFLRSVLSPPALVILSGDVHHGFVIDGLYAGAPTLDEIYRGKSTWAMRIVQITSSAIKNIKKSAFVDDKAIVTDYGNLGETLLAQYENQYKTMPDGTKIALRAAASRLKGDLGRTTYVFENHMCVVDVGSLVDVLFIGDARDSKLAFTWGLRKTMPSVVWTASTSVGLTNDPKAFQPPATWLVKQPGVVPLGIM